MCFVTNQNLSTGVYVAQGRIQSRDCLTNPSLMYASG